MYLGHGACCYTATRASGTPGPLDSKAQRLQDQELGTGGAELVPEEFLASALWFLYEAILEHLRGRTAHQTPQTS